MATKVLASGSDDVAAQLAQLDLEEQEAARVLAPCIDQFNSERRKLTAEIETAYIEANGAALSERLDQLGRELKAAGVTPS